MDTKQYNKRGKLRHNDNYYYNSRIYNGTLDSDDPMFKCFDGSNFLAEFWF